MQAGGTNDRNQGTGLSSEKENTARLRALLEAAGWIALVALLWGTDLLAKFSVRDQTGIGKDTFRLISEQVTSAAAVLVMVLFLVQWLKLFPLRLDGWPRAVIGHTIGSIIFAFGHFVLMVALRIPWYALNARTYVWREPFVSNLIVEYQKDIKIYIGFVIVISAYQYYRRSRVTVAQPRTDRMIVQTGAGDSVLRFEQIDYIEAARNYVSIHAEGREYVIRDTMSNLTRKLSDGPFARTHRSIIVNIDKIKEIRPVDSGQRVFLTSGDDVPLSRSYREEFTQKIGG
jgi:hypothetical protein